MKWNHFFEHLMLSFFTICTFAILGCALFLTFCSIQFIPSTVLWELIFTSFLGALANLVFYSKCELSKKQFLIRLPIHFLMIIALLFFAGYSFQWFSINDTPRMVFFLVLMTLIYFIISTIIWSTKKSLVKRLNEKLNAYKKQRGEENE